MAAPYFTDAGTFLVETLFGLYILIVLLRFLFARAGSGLPMASAVEWLHPAADGVS